MTNIYQLLPELEGEEMLFIQSLLKDYDETKAQQFASIYRTRRREPQTIMLVALLGFVGVAGVQRFLVDQIGMGILFFFTGGFCLIGTIVDLVSYKKLALDYNRRIAYEVLQMMKNY
jgi:TM2 domain-containing membrane protein YozV